MESGTRGEGQAGLAAVNFVATMHENTKIVELQSIVVGIRTGRRCKFGRLGTFVNCEDGVLPKKRDKPWDDVLLDVEWFDTFWLVE